MVNMCRNMADEMRMRSEWKACNRIKDVLKTNQKKILRAKLFNSTVLFAMLYASEMWATT